MSLTLRSICILKVLALLYHEQNSYKKNEETIRTHIKKSWKFDMSLKGWWLCCQLLFIAGSLLKISEFLLNFFKCSREWKASKFGIFYTFQNPKKLFFFGWSISKHLFHFEVFIFLEHKSWAQTLKFDRMGCRLESFFYLKDYIQCIWTSHSSYCLFLMEKKSKPLKCLPKTFENVVFFSIG